MPKLGKRETGSDPAKSKVQPPRERYVSKPLTAEERTMLLANREREAALYVNPDPQSGFDLVVRVFSATLDKSPEGADEIILSAKIEGQVLRPGIEAHSKGTMVTIHVPATFITEGLADE